ncbi:hypothetical protein [Helicobacter sp. WB40]|uniref:hypothetical protein n=1 Tax=Helicobacter sp. WB40 TaxID=3004130 RepID=UPI0022EBEB26|nr:hypothetical protein [Helicobacter sp. WB40]MDA3967587.1 hypothetical protein [Helicobacter sp. WB40]
MIIRDNAKWRFSGFFKFRKIVARTKRECGGVNIPALSDSINDLVYFAHSKGIVEFIDVKSVIEASVGYQYLLDTILNNFAYFLDNFLIIKQWLESSEFYKYKKENYPYPPLINPKSADYKNISSKQAFNLNLPLPRECKFIWLYPHGTDINGIIEYFANKVENLKIIIAYDCKSAKECYSYIL